MPARLLNRRSDLDALWGLGGPLPVETIDADAWSAAYTDRHRYRTLRAAGEVLAALRALRVTGTAHVRTLVDEHIIDPTIIDAAVAVRVELAAGPVLQVFPHRSGGTAAVFFETTPQRCWVLDLDDLASAATTLLTMTAEQLGDAAWASRHGVAASAVRLVPGAAGTWLLGVVTADGYLVAEPDGALVRASSHAAVAQPTLARTAAELTRESAALLAAA